MIFFDCPCVNVASRVGADVGPMFGAVGVGEPAGGGVDVGIDVASGA